MTEITYIETWGLFKKNEGVTFSSAGRPGAHQVGSKEPKAGNRSKISTWDHATLSLCVEQEHTRK